MTTATGDEHDGEERARQKFVDAINLGMERDDDFGQLVRDAVVRATGREGRVE
jgi:hypothetical protein